MCNPNRKTQWASPHVVWKHGGHWFPLCLLRQPASHTSSWRRQEGGYMGVQGGWKDGLWEVLKGQECLEE